MKRLHAQHRKLIQRKRAISLHATRVCFCIRALRIPEAFTWGVEITYDPRQFRLRVRDDGRGFDPKILEDGGRPDHWGLQGMRERP